MILTCPHCGHNSDAPFVADQEILQCDECKGRIAFGHGVQPWVILPHEDKRFLKIRIGRAEFVLDKPYAHAMALEFLSVLPPALGYPRAEPVAAPLRLEKVSLR